MNEYKDISDVEAVITRLQNELTKAQNAKKQFEAMSETDRLAIRLHTKLCHSEHTEGCSWFYEIQNGVHDWNQSTHKRYLVKAREILRIIPYEAAVRVIDVLPFGV